MRDRSSRLSTRSICRSHSTAIVSRYSRCFASSSPPRSSRRVSALIVVSGVRSSCETLLTNSDLSRSSSFSRFSRSSIRSAIALKIGPELGQPRAPLDRRSRGQIPFAEGAGGEAQAVQRAGDAARDEQRRGDRAEQRQQAETRQSRELPSRGAVQGRARHAHRHDVIGRPDPRHPVNALHVIERALHDRHRRAAGRRAR